MDYGKIAYSRILDLEAAQNAGGGFRATSVISEPHCIPRGSVVARYIGANALIAISISSDGEGELSVFLDGAEIGRGSGKSLAFFAAVTSDCDISVESDYASVSAVRVTAFGKGSLITTDEVKLVADSALGRVYAARLNGGQLIVYDVSEGCEQIANLGSASDFCIAAGGGSVYAAVVDNGNASVMRLGEGSIDLYAPLADDAKCIALGFAANGLYAAYSTSSAVYVVRLDTQLRASGWARVHTSPRVRQLSFIRGEESAAVIITDGDKNLLRTVAAEYAAASGLTISASIELE